MRIIDDVKLDFKDVLFVPKRSVLKSRKDVDLNRTFKFKHSSTAWTGVPIMAANMDGVGTFSMARALNEYGMFTCFAKSYDLDDFVQTSGNLRLSNEIHYNNNVAVSSGTSDKDWSKLQQILNSFPELNFICIDIANGYSEHFGDFVAKVRARYPTHTIIAGNVVTADMTHELILRGADIVKVGIGPGSVCTTRIQTGVGYPQLSAIIECADAAHGLGAHIIADGGCTCPGDVAKAFGAGADFVMLGGMLAGHMEGGGTIENGNVTFYGMSSKDAQEIHGGFKDYRASEGRAITMPFRGTVTTTVNEILGGLRSTCTYIGAPTLKQLSKCTTFVKVNRQINDVFLK
jgi:GMP reductase